MDISQKILSDVVIFQKYAKYIPEIKRREVWEELCERNMAMHIRRFPALKEEIKAVYRQYVFAKKILPSMRSMQFGGRPIELSNNRVYNCAYAAVNHPAVFSEAMFLLLGGTGFGFSVQKQHVAQLPVVKGPTEKTRRFLVGDSIEGWADSVKVLMKAYFQGKSDPIFDYRDIRPKGERLVTSGGKAPGPDPLRICLDQVRSVLNGARGRQLTPIECHDILCHIADAVLSGGIRRAALISTSGGFARRRPSPGWRGPPPARSAARRSGPPTTRSARSATCSRSTTANCATWQPGRRTSSSRSW